MDEARRLSELHEYRLLDHPADTELEAVVRLAAASAGVPTATLNLIDEHRQCQLSTTGFVGGDSAREDSMCAVRFLEGRTIHVPDARLHPDYADSPWVTGAQAQVRFYCSVPLTTPSGAVLGTLCVFDTEPRELSEHQLTLLQDAAEIVLALFERRRQSTRQSNLAAEAEEQRDLIELTLQEMEARQEFTDAVLNTVDVAIVASDADGRLTLFNRAAREWHGQEADASIDPLNFAQRYSLYQVDGTTPLPPEEIPLLKALNDGKVENAEMVIAPPHRAATRVTGSGYAITRGDGSPLGAVVALSDVTLDRAQQAALEVASVELAQRGAELERSNLELQQFAAVASHDLRSPLTVVDGYLALLQELAAASPDGPASSYVKAARTGVDRMLGLTDALLTHAQVGSGDCGSEPVDLNAVCQEVAADLRAEIEAAGARIEVPIALPVVSGDATLLRQLVQNVVGNSLKHRSPQRSCVVTVTAAPVPTGWEVVVADTGRRVPLHERERVFAMFTIGDGATRRGHGIGLATCHRIVRRHGGRIWLSDASQGGTAVHITLPAAGSPRGPS